MQSTTYPTQSQSLPLNNLIMFDCLSQNILSVSEYVSFRVRVCVDLLVWMCSWNRQTEDCQGKRRTSLRMNAICEFRYLIDPSGPRSLFSISIYHHFSSQDHINVSPSCLTHFPLFLCSQVSTRSVDQATHLPICSFLVSAPPPLPKNKSKPAAWQPGYWKLLNINSPVFTVKFGNDRCVGTDWHWCSACKQRIDAVADQGESTSSCERRSSPACSHTLHPCVFTYARDTSRELHLHTL